MRLLREEARLQSASRGMLQMAKKIEINQEDCLHVFEYQGMNVWYEPIFNQVLLEYKPGQYRKPDIGERWDLSKFGLTEIVNQWLKEHKWL